MTPITGAFVRLSNPRVQIYSAYLKFDAHFRGLRYYMYYWFFTTAFLYVSFMISLQIVMLILVSYWAGLGALFSTTRPWKHGEEEAEEEEIITTSIIKEESSDPDDTTGKISLIFGYYHNFI